jgi:GMP synthase (glutamine-hydrolysing)
MKVLAISHEDHKSEDDLGSLLSVIKDRGYELDLYIGKEDALSNIDPHEHDVAIIMGGPMGVYEADEYPYLYREILYIKQRLKDDLPTLGICLGGQLMAAALGAYNYKGKNGKEIGWLEINLTEEGQKTPLKYLDAAQTKMMQGHQDTFDLPEGVTLLATSSQYQNQAFSYGKNALGVQFHPEITDMMIDRWIKDGFLMDDDALKKQVLADTPKYKVTLEQQTSLFFNAWLDKVLS